MTTKDGSMTLEEIKAKYFEIEDNYGTISVEFKRYKDKDSVFYPSSYVEELKETHKLGMRALAKSLDAGYQGVIKELKKGNEWKENAFKLQLRISEELKSQLAEKEKELIVEKDLNNDFASDISQLQKQLAEKEKEYDDYATPARVKAYIWEISQLKQKLAELKEKSVSKEEIIIKLNSIDDRELVFPQIEKIILSLSKQEKK